MQLWHHFSRGDRKQTLLITNWCRFVNDEKRGNAVMKLKIFNIYPRVCLFAAKDIDPDEEIRYDYGDENAPWRKVLFYFPIL